MTIRLVQNSIARHSFKKCHVCEKTLDEELLISKETGRKAHSPVMFYHVKCARFVHIIVNDFKWNCKAKYKRFEILINCGMLQDEAEELSQLSYMKLPDDIKFKIDVYFMDRRKK